MAFLAPLVPYITAAAAVASTAVAYQQSQAASSANKRNAATAAMNQQLVAKQEQVALDINRRNQYKTIGSATAQYGSSGIANDTGSPLDVLNDSIKSASLDNLTTSMSYGIRGANYASQAGMYSSAANYATTAGYLNAGASALSGAANLARVLPPSSSVR